MARKKLPCVYCRHEADAHAGGKMFAKCSQCSKCRGYETIDDFDNLDWNS